MKYQIKDGENWVTVQKAIVTHKGWLDYELKEEDGGIVRGLVQPNKWRVKPDNRKKLNDYEDPLA